MADSKKPDGWQKLRRHDSPDGPPEVGYDKARGLNYSVLRDGSVKYHGKPEGYSFREGRLVPQENAVPAESDPPPPSAELPAQIVGTAEQPSSIPLTGEEGK
jgi:hypothetical protein